jgi:YcxB-like protein
LIIQYQVEKKDLFASSLLYVRHSNRTKWVCLYFFLLPLIWGAFKIPIKYWSLVVIVVELISALIIAIVASTLGVFVASVLTTAMAKPGEGVLGEHTIELKPEEFIERTDCNESHHFWNSVRQVKEAKNYLVVMLKNEQFHLIPKRAFVDSQTAHEFFSLAKKYHLEAGSLPA